MVRACVFLALAALVLVQADDPRLHAAIAARYNHFTAVARTQNATALLEFYSMNASVLVPGYPAFVGQDHIEMYLQGALKLFV